MSDKWLSPTLLINSDHPDVITFSKENAAGHDARERAVSLYYAVRDHFRYDPYDIDLSEAGMRASSVITKNRGWCVPKATLLTAACRAAGIPARLGFADVRNHLSTERMRATMKTDMFMWHGYTDIQIDGKWVKATPAFNLELCERFELLPLEFDGREDSIYHPFDKSGNRHMEYVNQRGTYDDLPLDQIIRDFEANYPDWLGQASVIRSANFMEDVEKEMS